MAIEQCWALRADRARCAEPAAPGAFFCERHSRGRGPHPVDIYCLPEREMPPGLVAAIRFRYPDWPLPEPSPTILTLGAPKRPLEPAGDPAPLPSAAPPPCRPADREASPADRSRASNAPALPGEPEEAPLDWLLAMLKAALEGVMVGDSTPLQKANMVARLGNLYLKASDASELRRANRELTCRVAALEERLAAALAVERGEPAEPGPTLGSVPGGRTRARPPRRAAEAPKQPTAPAPAAPVPTSGVSFEERDVVPRAAHLVAPAFSHAPP
jgi:hypothetical protein